MPRHKQVTTCRKSGGPVSNMCSCEHCCLAVCEVCGGAEGTLTTDCPGTKVAYDRHQEVFETNLDYTDDRGWHLAGFAHAVEHGQPYVHLAQTADGTPIPRRSPRFEDTKLPPEPPRPDPRMIVAPSINWAAVDRIADLKHALSLKAIAWVLADRVADEHSATLTRIEDEVAVHLPKGQEPNEHARELLETLEYEKIGFRLANQSAEKCDDEFRQAARRLVTTLEEGQVAAVSNDKMLFTRTCGCTVVAGAACPHFVAAKDPTPR
jgi:hypothetical protein